MGRRIFTPEEQALIRQGSLRKAAQAGMHDQHRAMVRERAEHQRMIDLAHGIHTEALLQTVLADVPEEMRAAVEKILRPHTRIPVEEHQ